ncbi:MAG: hypothetical protein R2823_01155 [Acidimicrobiia bacterium]
MKRPTTMIAPVGAPHCAASFGLLSAQRRAPEQRLGAGGCRTVGAMERLSGGTA